jgi:benzoylformate decarboxylase
MLLPVPHPAFRIAKAINPGMENLPHSVSVREAVFDLLRRLGIATIFGNPGSTELSMFRSFPRDFRYVLGLQEATVVGMADGYAQATGNAALVSLHSAAGVGNALGNIFTAFKNRAPMIVTAGQQARSILPYDPFLASSHPTELPRPYVKWSIEPARPQDVPLAFARAYHIAMLPPRGPAFISIPADDWDSASELVAQRTVSTELRPEPAVIERIGDALDHSERPAFVVGAAIDRDHAFDDVVRLAEKHNARVWTAPMCARCAFAENHALFAGFLPAAREKIVDLLAGHDLIFVIGAPAFTYHVEGKGPHIPDGTTLCQLIDDPATASWTPTGTIAVGSIRPGVLDLLSRPAPKQRSLPPRRARAPIAEPSKPMSVAFVLQTLDRLRPGNSIVVEEAPTARPVMQACMTFDRSQSFFTMDSGGLGYGMPASVGIALAKPDQRVIAVIGDGSAMYSIQALWSAAQLNLPIVFLILNNRRYAALQDFAPVFGFSPGESVQGTELPGIDFVAIARGQGCSALRVELPSELEPALIRAFQSTSPILIELPVA